MKNKTPKLLIVDDLETNRVSLVDALEDLDIIIHEASSGREALAATLHDEYFAIIMDVNMPTLNGFEAAELIRSHFDNLIPVIFLSAHYSADKIKDCYEAGGIDYLAKPIDSDIVVAKISFYRDYYLKKQHLHDLQRESSAMMESACDGIIGVDDDFNIKYANSMACELLSKEKDDLIGCSLGPFLIDDSVSQDWKDLPAYQAFLAKERFHADDVSMRHNGLGMVSVSYKLSPILNNDDLTGAVIVFRDITEQKKASELLANLAQYDQLTGLYNRMMFSSLLDQNISNVNRLGGGIALHFIDLDHFKEVNDSFGHDAGDIVLKEASERIKQCVRDYDVVARIGGDEFGIIQRLDQQWSIGAAGLAKRLVDLFEPSFKIHDQEAAIGCSIGIALYPDHANESSALIKAADTAMYKSKEAGRNQYHFYTEDLQEQVAEHLALVTALKQALSRDEIRVVYQPQVDTKNKTVCGLEALVRWRSRKLGNVSPAIFIPIAEQCGLISALGKWVLEEVCRQIKSWQLDGHELLRRTPVAVNISVSQLEKGNLADIVKDCLERAHLSSSLLKLEITENVLVEDQDAIITEINRIKSLGVDIAIDDFGTGCSSLSYLGTLPLQCMKIDREFVRDINTNTTNQKIVNSIIRLADSLGFEVIAEGIETKDELNLVNEYGCHIIQGYYFSRPIEANEVSRFIQTFSVDNYD